MELQQIDVYIDKNGQVRVEVRGAKGRTCLELTEDLEQALGGKVTAREMTPEATEAVAESAQDRLQRRVGQ
jgi:hypothetical protein